MTSTATPLARQNRFSLMALVDLVRVAPVARRGPLTQMPRLDRDHERLVAELRALPDAPADVEERLRRL